jgi:hypothetical protein
MAHRTPWDFEEAATAKRMLDSGMSYKEVAKALGRTVNSVDKGIFKFFGPRRKAGVDRYIVGEPIPLTRECETYRKDAKLGSAALRIACLDMFQRTANRYKISVDDAMACHLGFHSPPKLIRSPHGTASASRYLARAA